MPARPRPRPRPSVLAEGTIAGSGTLVYSSWRTMQARGESDSNTCAYNDLDLVKVDAGSFMDGQGRALGTLSTLALAPLVLSNGVGDLSRELAYAHRRPAPGERHRAILAGALTLRGGPGAADTGDPPRHGGYAAATTPYFCSWRSTSWRPVWPGRLSILASTRRTSARPSGEPYR